MKINLVKVRGESRFERARGDLSAALHDLEKVAKEKIQEAELNAQSSTNVAEQSQVIKNLSDEINRLQKELMELSKETDFLREVNKSLGQRLKDFRQQKDELVDEVESDLKAIHEVIEKYDS